MSSTPPPGAVSPPPPPIKRATCSLWDASFACSKNCNPLHPVATRRQFGVRGVWRTASPPSAQFLPKILQRGSYAPIAAQGFADPACRSDCRSHAGNASSGRTAPPIFQSVSIRQGQRRLYASYPRISFKACSQGAAGLRSPVKAPRGILKPPLSGRPHYWSERRISMASVANRAHCRRNLRGEERKGSRGGECLQGWVFGVPRCFGGLMFEHFFGLWAAT